MNEYENESEAVSPNHVGENPDSTRAAWERHYGRDKSRQQYPDENLVRMLARLADIPGAALDLGCGSGRHLKLLDDFGFAPLVGCDTSETSLAISAEIAPRAKLFAIAPSLSAPQEFRLPLPDAHCRVVVCWGVLHYNPDEFARAMLAEIERVLAPGGECLGTLRAHGDSHFQSNPDMQGARIRLFAEAEARELLTSAFDDVQLGYSERSPVGALEQRVCHWLFRARRIDDGATSGAGQSHRRASV